jgi:hypothetical protein
VLIKWAIVFGFVFASELSLADDSVLRIFCKPNQVGESPELATLRSDVVEEFPTSAIRFYDENKKPLKDILSYQPWQLNGKDFDVFIIGKTKDDKVNVYLSHVNMARRQASSEFISRSRDLDAGTKGAADYRNLNTDLMALSGSKLLFPGAREDEYVIFDLTDKSQKIFKSQKNTFNPRFSISSEHFIFDQYDGRHFQQLAFDLEGRPVFQSAKAKNDTLFLEFNPSNASWLYVHVNGDIASLHESLGRGQILLHKTFNTRFWKLPLVYGYKNQQFDILWTEYTLAEKRNEEDQVEFHLDEAFVHRLSLSSGQNSLQSYPYKGKILELPLRFGPLNPTFMSRTILSPNATELIFSLGIYGGLAKLNLTSGTWTLHGIHFRCLAPEAATEVQQ